MQLLLPLVLFAASAAAQITAILEPSPFETVSPGSSFVVDIQEEDTSSSRSELNLIIAIQQCDGGTCLTDEIFSGESNILFNGVLQPEFDSTQPQKGDHQSFTLTVPEGLSGQSAITITHAYGLGAAFTPFIEFLSTVVTVE